MFIEHCVPGFHISGICSDICSFNRIMRRIRLLSSLYLPAQCITVSCDREQPTAPAQADKRSAPCSPNELVWIRSAVAQTSSVDSVRFHCQHNLKTVHQVSAEVSSISSDVFHTSCF